MKQQYCQSCSMPMKDEAFATNADGSMNEDYCGYCMKDGVFTREMTMQEMLEFNVPHMTKSGMQESKAREILSATLPTLKRWA